MKATIPNQTGNKVTFQTYHEYVDSRRQELIDNPEEEGKLIYYAVIQMVAIAENGFSLEAKLSFPRIRYDFSKLSLIVWIGLMNAWFENLSPRDRKLFKTRPFSTKASLQFLPQ